MTRFERVMAAVNGKDVDRVPVSVWMHFSGVDQDPRRLAETQVAFNEKYDFDFIKLMPFGLYSAQDFGCQVEFFCKPGEEPIVFKNGIASPDEYMLMHPFEGTYGTYGKQLQIMEHMAKIAPKDTPYLMTLFSPFSTLNKLVGKRLKEDLVNCPEKVHYALKVITETTINFANECLKYGDYGFFFATQAATTDLLTEEQFKEFNVPYDLQVLNAVKDKTAFNIMHIHGDNIMFDIVKDYPCSCLNWHDRYTKPSLAEARAVTDKCLVGGIREVPYFKDGILLYDSILRRGTPEELKKHAIEAIDSVGGKGFMLAPGCVADPLTPEENIMAIRRALD